MIRSASRAALADLEPQIDAAATSAGADALPGIAAELYQVATLLDGQPQLRRTLGDTSTPVDGRVRLIDQLLTGKVSDVTREVVRATVSLRWSTPWDMTDALEVVGDRLLLDAADRGGVLTTVEDEIFRTGRILDANDELSSLLDEQVVPAERRATLLDELVRGKVDAITLQLLDHAVRSERKRTIGLAIDDLLEDAAARRHRSTANVRSAVALTEEQTNRIGTVLGHLYGRAIDVRTEIDPSVRGGLVVRVGDEIIDGSVAGRLAAVRTALTA